MNKKPLINWGKSQFIRGFFDCYKYLNKKYKCQKAKNPYRKYKNENEMQIECI